MDRPRNSRSQRKRRKIFNSLFSQEEKAISLIGEGVSVVGNLNFGDEVVRLDGHLDGKIKGPGTLIIGEKGLLEGEMNVGTLILCGRIDGEVLASGRAHITSTGKLFGKIFALQLIMDEGGILEGESVFLPPEEFLESSPKIK